MLLFIVGWYHRVNGHEFEQPSGDGEGQGSPVCCSPWGRKESDTTELLNNNDDDNKTVPAGEPKLAIKKKC